MALGKLRANPGGRIAIERKGPFWTLTRPKTGSLPGEQPYPLLSHGETLKAPFL